MSKPIAAFPLVFLGLVLVLLTSPLAGHAQCSGDRWKVKTGTDSDVNKVNLDSIVPTSVESLTAIAKPTKLPDNTRIKPTETTTWKITATLVKYVKSWDNDYHIVFRGDSGTTMIAEIPDPNCVASNSRFKSQIAHARAQFNAMFTPTTSFKTANVPATITGVGFFDYNEGQEGLAPNAIELHPIIDITFGPSLTVNSSPSSLNIVQGNSAQTTITSSPSNDFNSSLTLSATGLPAGVTATFDPAVIAAPGQGSSTLTLWTSASTPTGTYNVTVTATGGGQSSSTTVSMTVISSGGGTQQILGNPGFENGASSAAPWTATAGVIDNSTWESARSGAWKAWLDGFGTTHTDTVTQQVNVPTNLTAAALSFWLHIDTTETAASANDTLKVQIRNSSGTVLSTLATYSNLDASSGYSQATFDLLPYQGQTIQIYLIGVENASAKTSFVVDDFALNVTSSGGTNPGLSVSASPSSLTIQQNSSANAAITTSIFGGFNSVVSLSTSGVPAGTTASFSPSAIASPGSGSSVLTISPTTASPTGNYSVTVTASGGGLTKTATLDLTITAAPDMNVSASSTSVTIQQGASATVPVSTTVSGGFNSAVSFSAPDAPAGTTASFSPASISAPGSGSSVLTISSTASAPAGTYPVTITATGGGLTRTTSISLTITAANSPGLAVGVSPGSISIQQGTASTVSVSTTGSGGFNSAVSLSTTGVPAGTTAAFTPSGIAAPGSGSSVLTITPTASTSAGTYPLTITATGGGLTRTASLSLTVTAASGGGTTQQLLGNPGFENGSTSPAPWTVTTGVINNSASQASHSGTWKAWMNGYGSVHTDSVYQQVAIPSTATAATLTFWRHIDTAESSSTTAYDTLKVQVRDSAGNVLGTLATYSNLNAASGYTQVSLDLMAYKGQTVQIYFLGVEDSSFQTSFVIDDVALNVTTP